MGRKVADLATKWHIGLTVKDSIEYELICLFRVEVDL